MKWKFWKRSSKSKTAKAKKGKRQQKPEDCTECDSLRAIVDELRSYRDKVVQQQQELDTLQDLLITTKQRVSEIISSHNEATEKSKREEEWQLERLRSAILQMKKDHSEQMQALKTSKEEVEKEFQEYKTAAEHEQGEVETLGTELADLKEQHRYEKEQLKMQVSQAVDPQSHAWVLSLRPQQPAFHLAQMDRNRAAPGVIQAPHRTSGLSYNPSTSAFHTYSSRDHDVFMAHRSAQQSLEQQQERPSPPITAEDEEVASILANALPPGEYVRRHFGH